jgi:arylsulfatase
MTHTVDVPHDELIAKGPHIRQAVLGGPLQKVKPYTIEVRKEIDNELVAKSVDFMKRQTAAKKPFFLFLPFSMGHMPNFPSAQFAGKSRIGNYGDKIMEGDFHVGQILDAIKDLGIDNNTLVVFISDNGPAGHTARQLGNLGSPDMGNSGPFRGELGESSEGSIRTFGFIRWPGHVKPGTTSYAMFSIMDFLPTFAHVIGAKMPTDRPIDGVDQTDVLLGQSTMGHRDSLLTFVGPQLVAIRYKQWRIYLTDQSPTGIGTERSVGMGTSNSPMSGYPKIFNIEMDPHEDINVTETFSWTMEGVLETKRYLESLKKYPNPRSADLTVFGKYSGG